MYGRHGEDCIWCGSDNTWFTDQLGIRCWWNTLAFFRQQNMKWPTSSGIYHNPADNRLTVHANHGQVSGVSPWSCLLPQWGHWGPWLHGTCASLYVYGQQALEYLHNQYWGAEIAKCQPHEVDETHQGEVPEVRHCQWLHSLMLARAENLYEEGLLAVILITCVYNVEGPWSVGGSFHIQRRVDMPVFGVVCSDVLYAELSYVLDKPASWIFIIEWEQLHRNSADDIWGQACSCGGGRHRGREKAQDRRFRELLCAPVCAP